MQQQPGGKAKDENKLLDEIGGTFPNAAFNSAEDDENDESEATRFVDKFE